MFGGSYSYDMPNALSTKIKEKITHDGSNEVRYNMLYSVYSYPNIVLPLLGGILIDRLGLNVGMVVFCFLSLLGQSVFALSGWLGTDDKNNDYPYIIALTGRIIFGIGGDSLTVCQSVSVYRWFKGSELSFALSLTTTMGCLAIACGQYLSPLLDDKMSLGAALSTSAVICFCSFICAIIYAALEAKACREDKKEGKVFSNEIDKFNWRDIKEFKLPYWLVSVNIVCTFLSILCFNNIQNEFINIRYGFNEKEAGRVASIINVMSAFVAPVTGLIVDKIGYRLTTCIISQIFIIACHISMLMLPTSDDHNRSYYGLIPVFVLSTVYSTYTSAIWALVVLTVKPSLSGTAYGLSIVVENIGFSIYPSLVGALTFNENGNNKYFYVNVLLGCTAIIGLLISIWLLIIDTTSSLKLNGNLSDLKETDDNAEQNNSNESNEAFNHETEIAKHKND